MVRKIYIILLLILDMNIWNAQYLNSCAERENNSFEIIFEYKALEKKNGEV